MKERPILFSAPMVRALLAGTKTQTRRVCKTADAAALSCVVEVPDPAERGQVYNGSTFGDEDGDVQFSCPYGGRGDRLVVREAFRFPASLDQLSPSACGEKALDAGYSTPWAPTQFEADGARTGEWRGFDTPPVETVPGKLRSGIHMPRWASRILLEITDVRVERLQDISEADARAEGITFTDYGLDQWQKQSQGWGVEPTSHMQCMHSAPAAYGALWEQINGVGSWATNPWVWAVTFKSNHPR